MGKTVTNSVITPSWGQGDPSSPFPDTRSGTLAGRDHITGNPVVTTPGASSPTVGNIGAGGKVGTSVTLRVLNPNSGGRSVEVATGTTGSTPKRTTSSFTVRTSISSTTRPECDTRTPPPKKDPPEDDPEEPGKPPQGDGPISPPIPAPSDSPPTTGNPGCEPTSNTKWFAGSCPPGTQSLGSATLADGSVRSLCRGPSGKPNGCEPPAKWVCDSTIGTCVKSSTGGGYDTFEACMGAGCKRLRFSCVDGQCVETEGGEFPTYDACMSGGCAPKPGGDVPGISYNVNYTLLFKEINDFGQVTSTSPGWGQFNTLGPVTGPVIEPWIPTGFPQPSRTHWYTIVCFLGPSQQRNLISQRTGSPSMPTPVEVTSWIVTRNP